MIENVEPGRGLFGISVAAELTGVTPQALRAYEDKGLIRPERTAGGTRRYSSDDLARVQQITNLLADGVNLTGIAHILQLQNQIDQLTDQLHDTQPNQ